MTKFRFTGDLQFLGYTVPVDLWFDCTRTDLVDALSGLLCHVDDPTWPATDETPALDADQRPALTSPPAGGTEGGRAAATKCSNITSPHLFDDLNPGDDASNWLILAERFPELFPEEKSESAPGLPAPPKNRADIDKLRRNTLPPLQRGEGGVETPSHETDQFNADLATLLDIPQEELLKPDDTINASEIARRIGRRTGGSDWAYVQELAAHLQAIYDDNDITAAKWRAA